MNTITKTLTGLAALGTLVIPAGALTTAAADATTATPATATAVPICSNAMLEASYHHTDSGAGHRYGRIVLTNVSAQTCRMGGFGGLSYVGHGNGTQIGAAATREGGWSPFDLKPGQRAYSPVDEAVAQNYPAKTCKPTPVDGFRVYVPGATKSQYVPHPTTGCANAAIHLISHKSYRKA